MRSDGQWWRGHLMGCRLVACNLKIQNKTDERPGRWLSISRERPAAGTVPYKERGNHAGQKYIKSCFYFFSAA